MMVKELMTLKTVTNTLEEDVCSILCLEMPESTAWTYEHIQRLCKCLAIQEPFCQQEVTIMSSNRETYTRSGFNLELS